MSESTTNSTSREERLLELYEAYSREEIHRIFAPETVFTPQSGTWGLQGIVSIPDRSGDYVFFVTLGQQQGEHVFDEGITKDGVLSWQSQPQHRLDSPKIKEWIDHNELENSIYLFFRTQLRSNYAYLGKLKYLSHDVERERPVYFQWQILDWDPPEKIAESLTLTPSSIDTTGEESAAVADGLVETPPPPGRHGQTTSAFKTRKPPDYSAIEAGNRELGIRGERLVVEHEKYLLQQSGRPDLAEKVRHTSMVEGDGAGYDLLSFTDEGEPKYVEVKTTRGPSQSSFYMSANEVRFSKQHQDNYYLYRVYAYDDDRNSGKFYIATGDVSEVFNLTPTHYRVASSGD